MNTLHQPLAALALSLALAAPAFAADSHADHDHSTASGMAQHMQMMQSHQAASGTHQSQGLVRKIDLANGKITLRHGATADMGAMTMNYRVKDPALFDGLKVGDTVLFSAEKIDGAYTVTSLSRKP
ncbi:copper-binding protein [Thiomonas intermedia]|uniref:copper-binding protein n=1 Tax=Thiomonas intermedia TaxID=926 RepID=UPI0009A4CB20|nr:copper-binding protein [Thiomonas intermedia]